MLIDARRFSEGTTLEADVCVVGSGATGLVIAAELAARGRDVLLLDSGGARPDGLASALNDGRIIGDEYRSLRETRHRQLGGTAILWNTPIGRALGAKYAPLDPVDMRGRAGAAIDGAWPFQWSELAPWYRRAQHVCGLGAFDYDARHSPLANTLRFPAADGPLLPRLYHLGTRHALVDTRIHALAASSSTRLCTHATVVRMKLGADARLQCMEVTSPGSPRWTARASTFVLAAGAIENARLLLHAAAGRSAPGNAGDWVGRCFMEHPRDVALTLQPAATAIYADARFYDVHHGGDGHPILGRLALAGDIVQQEDLLNGSITLFPVVRDEVLRARSLLGPLMRSSALNRVLPGGGHGWSRHPWPNRVFDGFLLRMNLEQTPSRENRVELGSVPDALGVPLPVLRWRWRDEDRARLGRAHRLIAAEMERMGLGHVTHRDVRPDPHAHHHAGTTRMHRAPEQGVVNEHCRVHDVDNLYIAGASVFPSAGFANPALTSVALAVRLAHHLA